MGRMNAGKKWGLIVDEEPLPGSLNMAVDEFLFRRLTDRPETCLRFYRWKRPTASLGYFQNISRVLDADYCRRNGIDIVRRMTGGKLVLHYREVTYSLCSSDAVAFTSSLAESYRLISLALIRGLEKMGLKPGLADPPPASYAKGNLPCFSFPAQNEIEIDGRKIVGSAQKRSGSRFIQHGSIPLGGDERLLEAVSSLKNAENMMRMTSLSQAMGRKVGFRWAVERLREGMAEFFGVTLIPKRFGSAEKEAILKIQQERYASRDWTEG